MANQKGLLAFVYRCWNSRQQDTTNGGVSKYRDQFVLVGAGGPFEPSDSAPALYLAKWYGQIIACPVDLENNFPRTADIRDDCSITHLGGFMFGGNFLYSSDSRLPENAPIKIFDRRE